MPEAKLKLIKWQPVEKNTLRGFADIAFPFGLVIRDVAIHSKNGRRWVSLPAKPQLDADGTARRDDDGKLKYAAIFDWTDRALSDRFGSFVIKLVEAEHGAIP